MPVSTLTVSLQPSLLLGDQHFSSGAAENGDACEIRRAAGNNGASFR